MPKGNWGHAGHKHRPERDRIFSALEQTPDLSRGEIRLAAEVAVEELCGRDVPSFAHERAFSALRVLAKG